MKIFKDVNVYVDGGIRQTNVAFDEKIVSIGELCGCCGEVEEIVIPEGAVVVPGFVDQHIHGAGGADAMDGDVEALKKIAETIKIMLDDGLKSYSERSFLRAADFQGEKLDFKRDSYFEYVCNSVADTKLKT